MKYINEKCKKIKSVYRCNEKVKSIKKLYLSIVRNADEIVLIGDYNSEIGCELFLYNIILEN